MGQEGGGGKTKTSRYRQGSGELGGGRCSRGAGGRGWRVLGVLLVLRCFAFALGRGGGSRGGSGCDGGEQGCGDGLAVHHVSVFREENSLLRLCRFHLFRFSFPGISVDCVYRSHGLSLSCDRWRGLGRHNRRDCGLDVLADSGLHVAQAAINALRHGSRRLLQT